jgi:hypothetical protein
MTIFLLSRRFARNPVHDPESHHVHKACHVIASH